ncbi:30S ribosomal protein S6 [Candidatus Peregrinibacteria bacterium]|nr:30S ribosomal protein S6 [Candidatus Peregrinibacteria bacterium]
MAKAKNAEPRVVEAENKMYELMFVLKPNLLESAVTKKLKEFSKFLKEGECNVTMEDVWGKRKLAYRIKQFDEGIYVVYNMEAPTTFISEIDNHLRIDNEVIRHLLIIIDSGYKYSKFEEEVDEDPDKKNEPKREKKTVKKDEPKKEKPVAEEKKEEVAEEKEEITDDNVATQDLASEKEEVVEEKEEEEKEDKEKEEIDKKKLDSRLDDLLSGDDLNI